MYLAKVIAFTTSIFLFAEFQRKQDAISGSSSASNKSPVSEVYQAEEVDKRESLDQQMMEYVSPLSI